MPGSITITAPPIAPTSLTVASSANPSADHAPVTFTVQLTANGVPVANAAIALVLNTQSIQLVTDATGSASFTTSTLPIGATTVTASYTGTSAFAAATASLVQQVLAPTEDFSLTAASPSITLQTGHHGTLPLTLTSLGGFSGVVSIECTGQRPPDVTCELPASVALSSAASAPVSFTLNTDAVLNFYAAQRPAARGYSSLAFAMLLPLTLLGLARRGHFARRLLALLPLCLLAVGLTACNGYYPGSTPPGTYVIPVTATGSSQGSPVTHTLQVTLIVTP